METIDVLRLSFVPKQITADERKLHQRHDLSVNGYTVKKLSNGDAIVQIRHDGATKVTVRGKDPQVVLDDNALDWDGAWESQQDAGAFGGKLRVAATNGATMSV